MCRNGNGTGCGRVGWVDDDQKNTLTPEEIRQRNIENELRRIAQEQIEIKRRLEVLEAMQREWTSVDRYAATLRHNTRAQEWWTSKGVFPETVEQHRFGWCDACPTDPPDHRSSATIPVQYRHQLLNVRHRINGADKDKYRPQMKGAGNFPFNLDLLDLNLDWYILGEGEIKAAVASQWGFPTIGIPGARSWQAEWITYFDRVKKIYVCLDPGAEAYAWAIARQLGERARIVPLGFAKLDDFLTLGYGDPDDLKALLDQARPVETGGKSWRSA